MIAATNIGLLKILIGADAKGVVSGVKDAEGALGKLEAGVTRGSMVLAKMAVAATLAGAALVVGLTNSSLDTIDAQSKLARQLGGSVEAVQALERHADLAGISKEELTKATDKLNRKLGEAIRDGYAPTADALKRIGLNAKDLSKLDIDERMAAIADAVKAAGLNAQQTADLLGQLGIRSGKIFSLIEDGGAAIRSARDDVRLFGVAVSSFDARNIERANDAWTVFGLATRGIGNQLAVELAPLIETVATRFRQAVTEAGGMGEVVAPAVLKVVYAVGVLNREIHQTRLDFDEAAKGGIDFFDTIAGAIPRAIEALTRGAVTAADLGFEPIKNNFGKLRAEIGDAPDPQQWVEWFKTIQVQARVAGITIASIRDAMNGPRGNAADVDGLASRERESLAKRLLSLRESLASEDVALGVHREKQLKDIAEFEKNRLIDGAAADALRLQAEEKYQLARTALIQSKLEDGILTEDEVLARKFAKQLEDLRLFEENKTLTVAAAEEIRSKLIQQNAINQAQIQAKSWSGIASIVDTAMGQISGIVADEGEKGFTIMKGIAAATALVKGYEAAVSAYAFGAKIGGPPLGAVMAGVAIAGTAAYIAKLSGVGSGGGGSAPAASASSGGGSIAASADGGSGGEASVSRTLVVDGLGSDKRYSAEEIRTLIRSIEEYRNDGDMVVVR